jgi:hypothetical protein
MKLRSGKYKGYTVEEVIDIAPWYIRWVMENRPEMLSEKPSYNPAKKKVEQTYKPSAIKPNYDFDNEAEQHPGKVIKPLPKLSWDEAF